MDGSTLLDWMSSLSQNSDLKMPEILRLGQETKKSNRARSSSDLEAKT
jgi:hypothetical protein